MPIIWPILGGAPDRRLISADSAEHLRMGEEAALDLAYPEGTPVVAVHDATVQVVAAAPDCGNELQYTWMEAGDSWEVRYCHLQDFSYQVTIGEAIIQGQIVARVGHTGKATSPNLHIAIFINGERSHPEDLYFPQAPPPPGPTPPPGLRVAHVRLELDGIVLSGDLGEEP